MKEKRYEAAYAGFVYEAPATHWTPSTVVRQRLTKMDFTKPDGIELGGMPIISDGQTAFVDAADGHTAVLACSGMKKSICGFMPLIVSLAQAGENLIVTDPKGELYDRTAGLLQHRGYQVYCLNFRSMDKDCFKQVNVLNWSDFNVWSSAQIVEEHLLKKMPDNTAKAALRQCLSSPENTFRSILITASSFFGMFNQNPKLAAMLSHSTFTLGDLTNPKTALFLVTDDTTSTAEPILAMIISQIQSYLVDKAYHSKDGKLGTRMNFVLDEFASLPIPNMPKALATHRSRNIRYYLCIQSLALLKQRYPDPEMILSNCGSMLYLGSTELEMLKELETKLGTTRVTPDGSEKPLCSQAELMTLVKAWDHKMDDLFGISLEISVEQQPYPVLFTVTEEGCKAFAPDFPKIQIQAGTMETALMEAKKQIQKALSQFKYPPIPTRQEDIVVPENSVLILLKTA